MSERYLHVPRHDTWAGEYGGSRVRAAVRRHRRVERSGHSASGRRGCDQNQLCGAAGDRGGVPAAEERKRAGVRQRAAAGEQTQNISRRIARCPNRHPGRTDHGQPAAVDRISSCRAKEGLPVFGDSPGGGRRGAGRGGADPRRAIYVRGAGAAADCGSGTKMGGDDGVADPVGGDPAEPEISGGNGGTGGAHYPAEH